MADKTKIVDLQKARDKKEARDELRAIDEGKIPEEGAPYVCAMRQKTKEGQFKYSFGICRFINGTWYRHHTGMGPMINPWQEVIAFKPLPDFEVPMPPNEDNTGYGERL